MGAAGRILAALFVVLTTSAEVRAQEGAVARRAYLEAAADFFGLPFDEVAILSDWDIPLDEIPPVLFIARRAGVSPEALVALRHSGSGLSDLAERYGIGAAALHVPVRDQAATGALSPAYARYRGVPVGEWSTIRLSDADIVALVNVRMIAQALGLSAEEVIRHTGTTGSYVELFARLSRQD